MADIQPQRMSAIDVASLAPVECYAVLVHLAGNPDPAVSAALVDATRTTLARTRDEGPWFALPGGDQP